MIQEQYFFEGTEDVLFSVISGKPMAISNQMVYRSSKELIRAAQAFYFYAIKKFNYKLHSQIEKAVAKASPALKVLEIPPDIGEPFLSSGGLTCPEDRGRSLIFYT